jgi:hypothetical protein
MRGRAGRGRSGGRSGAGVLRDREMLLAHLTKASRLKGKKRGPRGDQEPPERQTGRPPETCRPGVTSMRFESSTNGRIRPTYLYYVREILRNTIRNAASHREPIFITITHPDR